MSPRSLVDGDPARCSESHGFDFCRGLRFFLCPTLRHVDHFTFHTVLFVFILERVVVGILYKDLYELFVDNYSVRDGHDNSR